MPWDFESLTGQTRRRKPRRIEDPIQIGIVRLLRMGLPPTWVVHHSPNGLKRSRSTGARAKALGTLKGYPDVVIHGSFGGGEDVEPFTGFIEIKAPKGTVSDAQDGVMAALAAHGFPVGIARSIDEAIALCHRWGLPLRVLQWGD